MSKFGKKISVRDANITCTFMYYQPELPQVVEKLNKMNERGKKECIKNYYVQRLWL
ncbi:cyclic lactone autoinducer peptide [Blautia sp. XA-2221]|uniref:cyclic lactone autoinducer peptide n=1 Tax=Blautia sp. XA-2221 TaxID=2903961 RepID=UPI0023795F6D|nr:cyclic lactone autoinducer peptide [Blautia sp. XA-2221]